ncbi:MAG: hypothetical protein V3S89_06765 [Desulfobacterales bacterium]
MSRWIIKSTTVMGLLLVIFSSVYVGAEEARPEASADMSVLNKYIWRGFELSDDGIVIQPSVAVSYKGLSLNLWGNLDTNYYLNDDAEFSETDMTLSYATGLGPVALDIGYIYYALDGSDTGEIYVSAGIDTLLSPSLSIYRDMDEFPGWYVNFGVSHSIDFGNGIALDLAASVGYMDADDTDYQEMHDGFISVGLTIPVAKYVTLSPMIAYSFGLSSEADALFEAGPSTESSFLLGGITLSMAF